MYTISYNQIIKLILYLLIEYIIKAFYLNRETVEGMVSMADRLLLSTKL